MFSRFSVLLFLLLIASDIGAQHLFTPIDTSSPRATIASFLALTQVAGRRYSAYRESPGPATQEALWQISVKAGRLFDMSQVPPATRSKVADETFYLLWEVLARLELPDLSEIPGVSAELPGRWRIPGSEIVLVRIETGSHAGEYLFSADTVKQAWGFYKSIRELPYLRPMAIENVYQVNQLITGWMIPLRWVEALPEWANTPVFGQVLWKWLALLLLFGFAVALVVGIFYWTRRRRTGNKGLRAYLLQLSTPVVILVAALLLWSIAVYQINLTGAAAELPDVLLQLVKGIAVVWMIWLTVRWVAETIIASPQISSRGLNASLIRLAARTIGLLAMTVLLFRVAHDIGVPVYGLVAGAGVGGLAIALAAKTTLENFIGTLNIYIDRPVRVGDFCRYGEDVSADWQRIGTIEEIGLRSTRLRGIDRTITTIPNAEFSNMHIVNLTRRNRILLSPTLGLRYETSDEQLRFVLTKLRELLHAHPKTTHTVQNPIRVRFVGFGDFSLNIAIRVYIRTTDYNEFLAIQEDILLRVIRVVDQAGTGFAFPSRTLYHTRDSGLDEERQQAAETQVREWVSAHTLPFPDLSEDQRKQMAGTLDYPPRGSSNTDKD